MCERKRKFYCEHYTEIYGSAIVQGLSLVENYAKIYDKAIVDVANGPIGGNARVYGKAQLKDSVSMKGESEAYGECILLNATRLENTAKVYGQANISGNSIINGNGRVYESAQVSNATVTTNGRAHGNLILNSGILDFDLDYGIFGFLNL